MSTVFDWVTLAVFAMIITLFLHRSLESEARGDDALIHYLVAAVGCAVTNYLGNEVNVYLAIVTLVATVAYFVAMLNPLNLLKR